MADSKLYNISFRQAEYRRVYMEQVGCFVVMSYCVVVRTVCCCMVGIQINTYLPGAINCGRFLQHRVHGVSYILKGSYEINVTWIKGNLWYFYKHSFNQNRQHKEAITAIYPLIPWEVVADTLGYAEHILGNTDLRECKIIPYDKSIHLQLHKKRQRPHYLDTQNSLPYSQEPSTCPHPEPG